MPGTVKSYRYYGKRGTLDSLTKFAITLKALSMNEMDGSVSVTAMRGALSIPRPPLQHSFL